MLMFIRGDMIGGPEGTGANKVDFTTGWTLVDVRSDPQNNDRKIIILTSTNGNISRHDLAADQGESGIQTAERSGNRRRGSHCTNFHTAVSIWNGKC